jgi:hypothetical protein
LNKNTCVLFLAAMLITASAAHAQPQGPDTLWTQTYHHPFQLATDVRWNADGGILLSGEYWNASSIDLYVAALDSLGNEVRFQTYGDSTLDDGGGFLAPESDGGFALGGYQTTAEQWGQYYLLHLNAEGRLLRQSTYGGYRGLSGRIERIGQALDGRFLLVGETNIGAVHPMLIQTTTNGDTAWARVMPDIFNAWMRGACSTGDGGWAVVGSGTPTEGGGMPVEDIQLIKFDSLGSVQFQRAYGRGDRDLGMDIAMMPDSGFTMVGQTHISDAPQPWSGYVIRTNAVGDTLWTRVFDEQNVELIYRVLACADSDVVLAGYVGMQDGGAHLSLTRLNTLGETVWRSLYPAGADWFYDCGLAVDDHGRYVLSCSKNIFSAYVLVTGPDPLSVSDPKYSSKRTPHNFQISLFPNPFNNTTAISYSLPRAANVTISLFDITGRLVRVVQEGRFEAGEHQVTLNAEGLASGIYFARLQTANQSKTVKLMLLR